MGAVQVAPGPQKTREEDCVTSQKNVCVGGQCSDRPAAGDRKKKWWIDGIMKRQKITQNPKMGNDGTAVEILNDGTTNPVLGPVYMEGGCSG